MSKKECNFGGASGGLIGGSGQYDTTNHTIDWTFKVNEDTTTHASGTVTLTVPAGLTYVSNSLTAPSGWAVDGNGMVVVVPENEAGTITLSTTVDDPNIWAVNNKDGKKFALEAALVAGSISLKAAPEVTTTSTMIVKESDPTSGYDFNTKKLSWKITFNQNHMAMTNPVITDTLPAGLTYVAGSASVTGGATLQNTTDLNGKLTFTFADIAANGTDVVLTFQTTVSDDLLHWPNATDPSAKIKNSATIKFNEAPTSLAVPSSLTAEKERMVGARPLAKKGQSNAVSRSFTWTIGINPNKIAMTAPTISDTLQEYLLLDLTSVKLYNANVNATTGALTQGALVYDGAAPSAGAGYTATLTGQTFTFAFQNNINSAYLLVFDTDNLYPYAQTFGNTALIAGEANKNSDSDTSASQSAYSGGFTSLSRGSIKLSAKVSGTSAPLANVTYTITGKNTGLTTKVTTDANGVANFLPLRFDEYTVTEDLSGIGGYLPLQSPPVATISATAKTYEKVLLYKTGASLVALDYRANAPGATGANPPQKSFASGAKVAVGQNPYSYDGYLFVGWNTQPDNGGTNYAPGDELTLNANTTLYAKWHRAEGKVTLTAMSNETTPVYFQDLSYVLKPEKAGAASLTETTAADGKLIFDTGLGKFTLQRQPFPRPAGYVPLSVSKDAFEILTDGGTDSTTVIYQRGFALDYDGNSHTSGDTPPTAYFPVGGTASLLAASPFARSGWDFTGWNTSADGTGTAYALGASLPMTQDFTLYAVWKARPTSGGSGGGGGGGGGGSSDKPIFTPPAKPAAPTVPETPGWVQTPPANWGAIVKNPPLAGRGGLVLSASQKDSALFVPGVVFEVEADGKTYTVTTDQNGYAVFSELPPGSYTARVVSVPQGYEFLLTQITDVQVPLGAWTSAQAQVYRGMKSIPSTGDHSVRSLAQIGLFVGVLLGVFALRKPRR